MPATRPDLTARLKRAVGPPDDPAVTDGRLLARFIGHRDEAAFALLVRRHGPMVLGVCQRVVGDAHLAEDAFQAAFLVLARKAEAVRPREAVGGWLYGVAYRVALRARTMAGRRRKRETLVATVPDRPGPTADPAREAELTAALDAEVARLSPPLRAAVVLCELEGRPRKDVARQLGIPEGTLSSRLAKARKVLAGRLKGRGVALTWAGLAALLARSAPASGVPAELAAAAAGMAAPAPVPAAVADLSRGVFRAMLLNKLKVLTAGVVMIAAAAGFAALAAQRVMASAASEPPDRPAAEAHAPKAADPGKIVVWNQGEPILVNPDGTGRTRLPAPPEWRDEYGVGSCRLSPDGSLLLAVPTDRWPADGSPIKAYVRGLAHRGAGDELLIGGKTHRLFWAPDGTVCGEGIDPTRAGKRKATPEEEYSGWRYDPKTKAVTRIPKEEDYKGVDRLLDAFPDGKWYLVQRPSTNATPNPSNPDPGSLRILTESGQTKLIAAADLTGASPRVSPDGKSILYSAISTDQRIQGPLPYDLFILDVAGGKPKRVELKDQNLDGRGLILSCCWSPDGKRVAFTWLSRQDVKWKPPAGPGPSAFRDFSDATTHLTVAGADGANPKTILTVKGRWIGPVDWR